MWPCAGNGMQTACGFSDVKASESILSVNMGCSGEEKHMLLLMKV